MKMVDLHRNVQLDLSYEEAERLYAFLDTVPQSTFDWFLSNPADEKSADIAIELMEKLDEYCNT